jgi:hypothetical protein
MNRYDFYYLDDFLKFSPNHANHNMVSSPHFRSPGTRSASAIVPVPEISSDAYHKEIYTVLFDPPSFIMVYSIVRHLWKLSKSKKFLPLPPLPPSQQEHSTDISEFCIDSIPDAEGEISASSTSVLESISSHHHYNFRFGNFHHTILDSKVLIPLIIPRIDVSTIEIGEIICFLKSENSQFKATEEYMQSKNLDFDFAASESTGISSVLEIAPSCFKDYGSIDAVSVISDIRFFELNSCINEFKKFVMKIDVLWSAENDFVASSMIKCNNAVYVTFSQYTVPIFDPGGVSSLSLSRCFVVR